MDEYLAYAAGEERRTGRASRETCFLLTSLYSSKDGCMVHIAWQLILELAAFILLYTYIYMDPSPLGSIIHSYFYNTMQTYTCSLTVSQSSVCFKLNLPSLLGRGASTPGFSTIGKVFKVGYHSCRGSEHHYPDYMCNDNIIPHTYDHTVVFCRYDYQAWLVYLNHNRGLHVGK